MSDDRFPSAEERDAKMRRQVLRGAWVFAIGFIVVYCSALVTPFIAYLMIILGAVLIGHGGNMAIRPFIFEGMRLRRQ